MAAQELESEQTNSSTTWGMVPKALDILKKDLAIFSNKIKERKERLNAKLSRNETISSAGERQRTQ